MSVRDLPRLMRIIDRLESASIVVSIGDEAVSFNLSDHARDRGDGLAHYRQLRAGLRHIVWEIYCDRGFAEVMARRAARPIQRGTPWKQAASNFTKSIMGGALSSRTAAGRIFSSTLTTSINLACSGASRLNAGYASLLSGLSRGLKTALRAAKELLTSTF
jgi:hypothetical protein